MGLNLAGLSGGAKAPDPAKAEEAAQPLVDKQGESLAPAQTVESIAEPEKAKKIYTSAPISQLRIGKFQFDKGVLTLDDSDEIAEFDALLKKLPPRERNSVRTISLELAESMVRPMEPGMTKSFDSSVGRQRERLATGDATMGTVALDAPIRTESRDDMNIALNEGQGTGDSTTAQQ